MRCAGDLKSVFTGAPAWLAGNGDVSQTKNEFLHCMGPWAQSLTSERKRKVRNKKELGFRTIPLLDSSIFLLSVSVLLSLYKNLIIKDDRDSSTLKSTYCPYRDPSLVPSIQKGPLTTFCKSRRMTLDSPLSPTSAFVSLYQCTHIHIIESHKNKSF